MSVLSRKDRLLPTGQTRIGEENGSILVVIYHNGHQQKPHERFLFSTEEDGIAP